MKLTNEGISLTRRELRNFAITSTALLIFGALGIIVNVVLDFPQWVVSVLLVMAFLGMFGCTIIIFGHLETMWRNRP